MHLSVTQCPSLLASHNPTRFIIIVIIYSGHRVRQPWLSVSIKLPKIVLNVLFIVEVFENKYCIVLYTVVVDINSAVVVDINIGCRH